MEFNFAWNFEYCVHIFLLKSFLRNGNNDQIKYILISKKKI